MSLEPTHTLLGVGSVAERLLNIYRTFPNPSPISLKQEGTIFNCVSSVVSRFLSVLQAPFRGREQKAGCNIADKRSNQVIYNQSQ